MQLEFQLQRYKNELQQINQNKISILTFSHYYPTLSEQMGLTQSIQKIQAFESYHVRVKKRQQSFYFGRSLQIYKNKFNKKQQFTKHTIKFDQAKQMQQFIKQVQQLKDSKDIQNPFNVLFPVNVFLKQEGFLKNNISSNCNGKANEVIIIHKFLEKSLEGYIDEKNGSLDQRSIWFIINEISKSLEMLQQKTHASYFVMPQNIFCNQNQNWFLYDGYFILGGQANIQFNKSKPKNKLFMSEDFRKKVQANVLIASYDALQQDVFCFGFCIIFMMTGIHPKKMPEKSHERQNYINDLLDALIDHQDREQKEQQHLDNYSHLNRYSGQLINFVKNLIKADPRKRFTVRHIRSSLKTKQQQIFKNQQQQWSKTTQQNRHVRQSQSQIQIAGNKTSKLGKFKNLKSSQRNYQKNVSTEYSDANQRNITSMRTLKKQSAQQKLVMMNSQRIAYFPISLNENEYLNDRVDRSEQVTPIRKVADITTNNFIPARLKTRNSLEVEESTRIQNSSSNKLRQINSPVKRQSRVPHISPKKLSTTPVNVPPFGRNISNWQYQQPITNYYQPGASHLNMFPSSHYNNDAFHSRVKVKMTYFSPQKGAF